jgi:hypothetical protein
MKEQRVKIVSVEEDVRVVHPQTREDMVKFINRVNYLFEGDVEFNKKVILRACKLAAQKYGKVPNEWMRVVEEIMGY